MGTARLLVERDQSVVTLTLSGGVLGAREAVDLREAARELADDTVVRAVVLQSPAADFCTGPDAALRAQRLALDPASALGALTVPVVVALAGAVRSVGVELALACDIRIAAQDTSFAFPEVGEGSLPSWGGTQRLPRTVGRPLAFAMLVLGRSLSASEALASSLVHELAAEPAARAHELARTLSGLGPLAVRYAKEAVLRGAEMPFREGIGLEADLNTLLQSSEDRREGLAAFLEKRPPVFRGA